MPIVLAGEKTSKDCNMEDVEVISESEDENGVELVTEYSKKAGDATHKSAKVPAKESVSAENVSDGKRAKVPMDPAIVAKQQEILRRLPFIEEVKKTFSATLSQGQFSRLDALIRLVNRDNVTMSTLLKIESIMNKLETRFGELVRDRLAREARETRRLDAQRSQAKDRTTARESSAGTTPQTNKHKQKDSGSNTNPGPTKRKEKPSSATRDDTISISSSGSDSEDPKESTNRKRDPQSKSTTSTGSAGSKASTAGRKSVPPLPTSTVAETAARKSFASSSPSLSSNKPRNDRSPERKNTTSAANTQGTNSDQKKPEACKSQSSQKSKEKDKPPPEGQGLLAAIRAARELDREQKQARELANKERAKARSLQFNASANLGFSRRSNTDPATARTAFTQQSASTSEAVVRQSTPNEGPQQQQQQQPPTEPSNGIPPPSICDKDAASCETPTSPLSEARKKLAAMLMDKLDPPGGVGVPSTLPLASNSMDPRGRNPNYNSHTLLATNSNALSSLAVHSPSVTRDTSPVPPAPPMKTTMSVWTPIPGSETGPGTRSGAGSGLGPRVGPGPRAGPGPGAGTGPGSIGFASRGSRGAHARPSQNFYGNERPGLSDGETNSSCPAPRFPNSFHAVDPRSMPCEATWGPREARNPWGPGPRSQNMPRPNHQHNQQQQQGYSQGNPANWQQWNNSEKNAVNGGPGSGVGSGSVPGPRPNFVAGSFRGGHEGRGRGCVGGINHRYISPGAGRGGGRGGGGAQYDAPRTYREHREAKARAEAAAAAKVAEEQRLAEIEKKRQLEAAEKQRQQEEIDSATASVAVTALPELQLDTSYRSVTSNGPSKKIDFRIPKKTTTTPATTTAKSKGDETASSSTSPSTNKSCNDIDREKDKSTENNKDAPATDNDLPNAEKESTRKSPKDIERTERVEKKSKSKDADKNKNKSKDEDKTKKEDAQAAKKAKLKRKKESNKLDKLQKEKDDNRTEKNEQKEASDKKAASSTPTPPTPSFPSSSSTAEINGGLSHSFSDNMENEPPMVCIPNMPQDKAAEGKLTTPAIQPEDAASETGLNKSKTEAGPEGKPDNATETATDAAIDAESDEKVPKMKIILGPNGHITFLSSDNAPSLLEGYGQKFKVNTNGDENANGDGEKLRPTANPQMNRIMRRRSSMAPTASRPLVDKASIFNGSSLMYEDLTEQKRKEEKQSQKARNLANIFEKTSDNCRLSTQNIITGKRRTRGIPECSFNETMLSRNRFGLGQINRTAKATPEEKKPRSTSVPQADTDTNAGSKVGTASPPVRRKRGRPPASAKNAPVQASKRPRLDIEKISVPIEVESSDEQSVAPTPPPPAPQTPHRVTPGKPRGRKRNELEKLIDYISTMYNGEDVTRASGRRACTVPQAQRRSVTPMEDGESTSIETSPSTSPCPSPVRRPIPREIRNVARRGRPFGVHSRASGGINRASSILQREMRMRKCCVRLQRFPMPQDNVPKQPTPQAMPQRKEQQKRRSLRTEPNVDSEWNVMSMAAVDCVVCHKKIDKNPAGHYLQLHKENYISRLAPGMLDELRAGRCNRLRLAAGDGNKNKYDFTCPFCTKALYSFSFCNIAQHLIEHTGESKFQCSACRQPIRRHGLMKRHRKNCAPEAQVVADKRTCRLPLSLHVCPLCDYVQTGRERRDAHLVRHHRLSEELIAAMELEKVVLCCTSATEDKDPETEAGTAPKMSVPQVISRRSSVVGSKSPKKKIRFKKQQRKPDRPLKREQESHEEEEEQEQTQEDGMPSSQEMEEIQVPPLKEDAAAESMLVINECLMDIDSELEMDLRLLDDQLMEEAETELLQSESRLQEKTVEQKPILAELLPMEEQDALIHEPAEVEATCSKDTAEEEQIVSGLSVDPLMGIGSDESDSEMDVDVVGVEDVDTASASAPASATETGPGLKDVDPDANKRVREDWVDLVETGSQDESRSKSIFRKFRRFYSRLTNGTTGGGGGEKSSSPRRSSSRTTQSNGSNSSDCDPSELMPEMRPLEPETETKRAALEIQIKAVPPLVPIGAPTAAPAAPEAAAAPDVPAPVDNPPLSAYTRVENVAYRMRDGQVPPSAVYCCLYPGCTFLFSNEREGLERHFNIEHPQVSWSGSCFTCITQDQTKAMLTPPRSIGDELRHLAQNHMPAAAANPPEKLAVAKPALPKLRVRRFSGDLLTEAAKQVEQQQPNVGDVDGDANGMLRDLLKATPRPINQQVDFNAAGLGEFLCAKPATPPASSATETEKQASTANGGLIYNNKENTGLQIVTVFHVDASQTQNEAAERTALPPVPVPVPDPVPVPVLPEPLSIVNNGHFRVTQSITENRINISLEPAAAKKGATGASGEPPTTTGTGEDGGRNSNNLSMDRFRCMAVGCGFCSHTVMCIREHMNFHRFSFGSTNYLNCAYCEHVATDVDDYARHGVYVHGLAPRHELHEATSRPAGEMSVSQQIREALSQRRNAFPGTVAAAVPAPAEDALASSTSGQAQGMGTAPGSGPNGSNGGVTIAKALSEYLEPTGVADDKLFECPEKNCGARLTNESFVNHILYHIRSSSSRRETELVKCRYCRWSEPAPILRQHLLTHHGRHKYICSLCLETACSKDMLIFHVKQAHPQVLGLPNHSIKVIKVYMQESHGLKGGRGQTVCHVVGVLMPFEHDQLQALKHKVIRELKMRQAGTKNVFRSSEAKLLPSGDTVLTVSLHCAECLFISKEVVAMQRHLAMHKLQTINAFKESQRLLQGSSPEKLANPEPTPVAGGDSATAGTVANAPAVGGKHKVVNPYMVYVPSPARFICGAINCETQLPSMDALIKHMSEDHHYTDVMMCTFCRSRQPNKMSIPKFLKHLLTHKRHIYQCGECGRCNPERHIIERHISDRHLHLNVDVVIHRQEGCARLKTTARWIKLPKLSRHPSHNNYICNLCQQMENSMEKIRGHVEAVHAIKHQFICSVAQCSFGSMDAVAAIQHMLDKHPSAEVQPAHIYQRTLSRIRQTIGFYCCHCRLAFPTFQRTVSHLKEFHVSLCQYKCPHCEYTCQHERGVITHMIEEHPDLSGLAECQFLRVFNDLPDKMAWAAAHPIEEAQQEQQQDEEQQQQEEESQDEDPDPDEDVEPEDQEVQQTAPLAANSGISEVIDLLDSDDEAQPGTERANRNVSEPVALPEQNKGLSKHNLGNNFYVFCCFHCGISTRNLMDLKAHQTQWHPNQPFLFRVQSILLCCLCKTFRGTAKELRDHLIESHKHSRHLTAIGCDVRRPKECGYCDHPYTSCTNLSLHTGYAGHQINDLKNVTEAGLEVLLKLNRSENGAEYFQMCSLCKKVLPDQIAMYHHGQQKHADQGFCFTNVHPLVYRCNHCLFTSLEEMLSLRHIITHFEGFNRCHFCMKSQPGGFEEYIQHCYTKHYEEVGRFREVYRYELILRYLLEIQYQFQNGLIINKGSLLKTRYKNDTLIRQLYEELMARAERPPIPRIHIGLKKSTTIANQGAEPVPKKAKIIRRRQTLGPDQLIRPRLLDEQRLNPALATATAAAAAACWSTSFTGANPIAPLQPPQSVAASTAAPATASPAAACWSTSFTGTNPIAPLQPPRTVAAATAAPTAAPTVAPTAAPTAAASASNQQTTAGLKEKIIRNLKRRNSVVVFSRP